MGPVGIWQGERPLGPTAAQQRSVLAMLLMASGRVVSVDRLVLAVWGEDPPGSARNAVQVQISKLRRILSALPGAELTTSAKGYSLTAAREQVDLHRFRDLVRAAREAPKDAVAAGEPEAAEARAGELLRAALQLWRGPALADVAGGWLPETLGAGLEEERRAAVEECAAIDLRSGRHHEAAAELSALVAEHPLRERSVALLMEALRRCGRRADALALFRSTRRRYVEELGIEPGDELQRLHRQALEDSRDGRDGRDGQEGRDGRSVDPSGPSGGYGSAPAAPTPPDAAPAPASAPVPAPEPAPEGAPPADEAPGLATEPAAEPSGMPATAPAQITAVTAVPQQLPSDVTHFTGRERELAGLDALLPTGTGEGDGGGGGRASTAARITVIAGSGGLGKTTLAVHWAHRVRDRFPDGQLYVNLRGFGPTDSAMTVAEAVRGFLDAFQVPAHRIPATLEAQTALYRSLLADRRMLILLDNARDAEQVRPLLPGSPGCLVVLTSRNELTSLVVAEQAQPLPLDLLDRDEARELLSSRVGAERVAAEPEAVEEVITVCAGLPLALAIVAARAATHPRFGLEALAGELRDARGSLDAFEGGDATTDVRAVFSWSYHTLGADAARLFRLLGVHPGPDIAAPAAASLVGIPVPQARRLLIQLTRAHLITERAPGQYGFHDLLRAYAMELTQAYDAREERRTALHRMLDHYLHTAVAAGRAFTPHREPITVEPVRPGVSVGEFAGHGQALLWFIVTYPALMAALQEAAEAGFETHTWQLAWSLTEFLDQRGHWHDQRTVHRIALGSAHRIRDLAGQAHSCYALGLADLRMGRYDRARGHLVRALNLYGETGNAVGQALAHGALNLASEREGRHDEGLHHALRALKLYRAAGHRSGEAYALNNVGWAYAMLGDFQQTLVHCEKALTMLRQAGDRRGESAAWDSLGYAHQHVGDHQQAISCYRHAVDLRRGRGERVREAESLHRLGSAQLAAGDRAGARRSWQRALTRFDSLGHPDAHRVRDGLTGLGGADG
ncbi:AfsR/SARP family transcriptional regulator [Streptomyces rapamycinicus]|nr:BTAD domain-containing putative transcriptional regulator [Streptomyces rapamycinicus]MBB4782429.1 DNA-binding SARP family transcriptional activator/tetratricopeptide (TPR) repeat protein [Streptomyces rapamycinicus]UTO62938.1 tetratricopeptide repeat protein [Streptomyces rapamycinicus]UTP30896.1 tetratricopeptide repeat protein [Streptomyces rapamycinicus NRRL 5491]